MIDYLRELLLKLNLLHPIRVIRDYISRDKIIEQKRVNHYREFIYKGDLVFDIGANLGNRTTVFTCLGGRVISFEPQGYCFKYLKWRFLFDRKVTIIKAAVSDKVALQTMLISQEHVLSSLSTKWIEKVKSTKRFEASKWDKIETVQTNILITKWFGKK